MGHTIWEDPPVYIMSNNQSDGLKDNGHIKIHFIYVVIILVAIIITIVTCRLSDNQQVTSIISFAGTVTSIILSVLAIFITVLSNDSMNGLMEKIRSLTDSIKPAEEHMKQASDKIESTISGLDTVKEELKKTSYQIKLASDSIVKSTKELSENICGKIEEKMTDIQAVISHNTNTKYESHCELDTKTYIKRISYVGLLMLYALFLCKEKSKIFNSATFYSNVAKYASSDYTLGLLVASYAAGYIKYKNGKNGIFENIDLDYSLTKELIISEIKERERSADYDAIDITDIESFVDNSSCNETK